jgi:chromosome segregation ATPase
MSVPPEILQGGAGGLVVVAGWLAGRRWPGGRIRISATAVSEQTEATKRQTKAIERQTEASNRVAERLGQMDGRLDTAAHVQADLAADIRDLSTEVRELRDTVGGVDRRVIRLEATHDLNGHGHHNGARA